MKVTAAVLRKDDGDAFRTGSINDCVLINQHVPRISRVTAKTVRLRLTVDFLFLFLFSFTSLGRYLGPLLSLHLSTYLSTCVPGWFFLSVLSLSMSAEVCYAISSCQLISVTHLYLARVRLGKNYSVLSLSVSAELVSVQTHTGYEPCVLIRRQNTNRRDLNFERTTSYHFHHGEIRPYLPADGRCRRGGNYARWSQQITKCLWDHCSSGVDASDLAELISTKPIPKDSLAITADEKVLDWLAKDTQAKALIDRKTSPVIVNQLAVTQTAREQWLILSERYERKDLLSQYELRAHVRSEKLKDADDVPRYLGVFDDARRRFIQMGLGVTYYSNDEAIFDLLQGLPEMVVEWQIFKEFTMSCLSTPSTTIAVTIVSTSATPSPPSTSNYRTQRVYRSTGFYQHLHHFHHFHFLIASYL